MTDFEKIIKLLKNPTDHFNITTTRIGAEHSILYQSLYGCLLFNFDEKDEFKRMIIQNKR